MAGSPHRDARTLQSARSVLRVHILPDLGRARLGDLDPGDVRAWHARVRARTGPSAASHAYRTLSAILNDAVVCELIVRNPAKIKKAGKDPKPSQHEVTADQVAALAAAVPERCRALVLLAAWAGLRSGELFGLERGDVDLLHRRVRVERARTRTADGVRHVGPPNSDADVRTVGLPPIAAQALEAHLSAFTATGRESLVFTTITGLPLDSQSWGHHWRRARRAVAADDPDFDIGLRFHELRAFAVTEAIRAGAPPQRLMRRFGWSAAQVIAVYARLVPDDDDALAARIGQPRAAVLELADRRR